MFRTLAALIVVGSLASTAVIAAGPGSTGSGIKGTSGRTTSFSSGGSNSRGSFDRNYHLTHGTRFDHGYFYRGRDHFQWSYLHMWNSRYGCFYLLGPAVHELQLLLVPTVQLLLPGDLLPLWHLLLAE